jgi:hypothetical protein
MTDFSINAVQPFRVIECDGHNFILFLVKDSHYDPLSLLKAHLKTPSCGRG